MTNDDNMGFAPEAATRGGLLLFAAVALAVTGFHLALMRPEVGWNGDDYAAYVRNAWSLAHGAPYPMRHYLENPLMDAGIGAYPPMYPALLALPVALFGENFAVLTGFTILLYGGFCFVFMVYARALTGTLGAALAGLVVGVGPFAYFWKDSVMSEFCFNFILFLAFLAERAFARRASFGTSVGVGVGMAACVLTRAVGAAIWPAVLVADVVRMRRVRGVTVAALLGSVMLVVAALLAVNSDSMTKYLHLFEVNSMLQATHGDAAGVTMGLAAPVSLTLADRVRVVAGNVGETPGKLSMLWSFGTQLNVGLKAGPAGLAERAATGGLLLLGAAGLLLRLRAGASAAEFFFVFELAGLLLMPRILITTRLFLPLSAMVVMYAFVTVRAIVGWLGRGAVALPVVCFLLFSGVGGLAYAGLLSAPRERFTADAPPARDLFRWVTENTAEDAMFISRSPRALIFFTGRGASDFHLSRADRAFLDWAKSIRADYFVLNVDMLEVRAIAREQGISADRALDAYEARFFADGRAHFAPAFRNDWFRVYRVLY